MPLRRISAADAFRTMKVNSDSTWPRRDDPANRFAHFADPSFTPRFTLEPGQRIFTIGSCFARNVEQTLSARGFDIPTMAIQLDKGDWGGDPTAVLNNYVPPAIAPQIRWAFGLDTFDINKHSADMGRGRYVDLQLPMGFRPMPAEAILRRRETISAIYRNLAQSQVVLITLGLIEAWYDNLSGLYINCPPPKSASRSDPSRFELHVLDYNEVSASLNELVELLGRVCPPAHRLILTVSPVPLTATFTESDVAVANMYSKSVLRAAIEPLIAAHRHIEYFPSFESVLLTDRSVAFADDQIHVQGAIVRFNVDRMIRRYVRTNGKETVADVIAQAREDAKAGLFRVGLKRLQQAWAEHAGDPALTLELARMQLNGGDGAMAEALLLKLLESGENVTARNMLARYYNESGRYQEAALHGEKASETGKMRLNTSLQRVVAYYHLGRFEEGLAVMNRITFALEQKPLVIYWKARCHEKLGHVEEAENFYRQCNGMAEQVAYQAAFADFLAAQGRWPEVAEWVDRILIEAPEDKTALRLRTEIRGRNIDKESVQPIVAPAASRRWLSDLARLVGRALPFARSPHGKRSRSQN